MVLKTIYTNGHHLITELYLYSCNSPFYKNQGDTDFYKSRKKYVLMLFTRTTHFRQLSKDKVEKPAHVMETDFWVQSLTLPL